MVGLEGLVLNCSFVPLAEKKICGSLKSARPGLLAIVSRMSVQMSSRYLGLQMVPDRSLRMITRRNDESSLDLVRPRNGQRMPMTGRKMLSVMRSQIFVHGRMKDLVHPPRQLVICDRHDLPSCLVGRCGNKMCTAIS
jgi:hypothetical protein